MKHPITDEEREAGTVTLVVLPEHAEAIDQFLATHGAALSPPARFGDGEPMRTVTLILDESGEEA